MEEAAIKREREKERIVSVTKQGWMHAQLFLNFSIPSKKCQKTKYSAAAFLESTVTRKASKDLNMSACKRRLKGEDVLMHADMMRTSGNGGTINQQKA